MTKKSKQGSQYVKVALMCIAALVIFYFGTQYLKGIDIFGSRTYYYCVFEDCGGLVESTPVQLNGYKIGKVEKVSLLSARPVRICAKLLITENIKFPDDTRFEVASASLLGGNSLNVQYGKSSKFANEGDTLLCGVKPGLLDGFADLGDKVNSILNSVDTIGLSLKDVLYTQGGGEDLKGTLANLESTTANLNDILAQNKSKVGLLVSDLQDFSSTLNEASPKLHNVIDNFDKISDSLAKADIAAVINNANSTISEIETLVKKINKGDGDIGQLANNDSLYRNLESTTNSLNLLLQDLKENPKRYVHFSLFGRKDKKDKEKKK
ncbi:MAG: MCE family protein [Bacteroidales bacterium]|nr:MCE family protein [Bacteroidales bacterium]